MFLKLSSKSLFQAGVIIFILHMNPRSWRQSMTELLSTLPWSLSIRRSREPPIPIFLCRNLRKVFKIQIKNKNPEVTLPSACIHLRFIQCLRSSMCICSLPEQEKKVMPLQQLVVKNTVKNSLDFFHVTVHIILLFSNFINLL